MWVWTSSSIRSCAGKPIILRSRSVSELSCSSNEDALCRLSSWFSLRSFLFDSNPGRSHESALDWGARPHGTEYLSLCYTT